MTSQDLVNAFRWRRQSQARGETPTQSRMPGVRDYAAAATALAMARRDVADGKTRYPAPALNAARLTAAPLAIPPYPARKPLASVFFEAEPAALRLVGFADKVATDISHTGWYTRFEDYDSNSSYRGVVFQLPAHKGRARYVAGYQETEGGGYIVDLDEVHVSERGGAGYAGVSGAADERAAREAARAGDGMAERAAEESRDYDEARQSGSEWNGLGEEVAELRGRVLDILRERRRPALVNGVQTTLSAVLRDAPGVRAELCDRLGELLESISDARAKRAKLADDCPTWLASAFNEGAGRVVV